MTVEELEQWQAEFEAFHARFADLFERSESREQARKYLRGLLTEAERKNSWQVAEAVGDRIPDRMQGLLSPIERKNGWQLAEEAGESTPYAMQYLLDRAVWDAEQLRDMMRE